VKLVHEKLTRKCQYAGCNELATEFAIGGDEEGGEHVYNVCLKHAFEMEPYQFKDKWMRSIRTNSLPEG